MAPTFTPATQRALAAAGRFSAGVEPNLLHLPEVLLGLLAEPECRAAQILERFQVDSATVRSRWTHLSERDTTPDQPSRFSSDLHSAIQLACERLCDLPQPLPLATEHLLLGLATLESEVSVWLREQGLDVDTLKAEIFRIYGQMPGPLEVDEDIESPSRAKDSQDASISLSEPDERAVMEMSIDELSATDVSPVPEQHHDLSPGGETAALRIIDAGFNRATEGLRVIEDYARFVLDDRHLTELCKRLRHGLTSAMEPIPCAVRHAARETERDVGRNVTTRQEYERADLTSVLAANFKRLQQALRSMEEYAKVVAPEAAEVLESLRYRAYTLERAIDVTAASIERLAEARLYVLIDGGRSSDEMAARASSLIAAGVHVLQLRDKSLPDGELLERARRLRELTAGSDALLIVNDRPDLAALSRADGVHIGQHELSVKDARSIIGPRALIGVSTHSIEQARKAVIDGANYLGVGPTFPTETKALVDFPGLSLLQAIAGEIKLPAFAIGGIRRQNLPEVLATGIGRVAVCGTIASAENPAAAAREILACLSGG